MEWPRRSTHAQLCMKELSRVVGFLCWLLCLITFHSSLPLIFLNIMFWGVSLPSPRTLPVAMFYHIFSGYSYFSLSCQYILTNHSFFLSSSVYYEYLSWFQTFAVFWVFYAFFWVIPRLLNFICRRFRTLCLFHLHRQVGACLWRWNI